MMIRVIRGIIAIVGGFLVSLVSTAAWWYFLSFYESPRSSFPVPMSVGRGSGLALLAGIYAGGLFGIVASPIILAFRQNKVNSSIIGAVLGVFLFLIFILLPSGGMSNVTFIALASFIPIGALTGFVISLLFGKSKSNSLT